MRGDIRGQAVRIAPYVLKSIVASSLFSTNGECHRSTIRKFLCFMNMLYYKTICWPLNTFILTGVPSAERCDIAWIGYSIDNECLISPQTGKITEWENSFSKRPHMSVLHLCQLPVKTNWVYMFNMSCLLHEWFVVRLSYSGWWTYNISMADYLTLYSGMCVS